MGINILNLKTERVFKNILQNDSRTKLQQILDVTCDCPAGKFIGPKLQSCTEGITMFAKIGLIAQRIHDVLLTVKIYTSNTIGPPCLTMEMLFFCS